MMAGFAELKPQMDSIFAEVEKCLPSIDNLSDVSIFKNPPSLVYISFLINFLFVVYGQFNQINAIIQIDKTNLISTKLFHPQSGFKKLFQVSNMN